MKSRLCYAVVEVGLNGKINLAVSHWYFENHSEALEFANEIGSKNPECMFMVIVLTKTARRIGE